MKLYMVKFWEYRGDIVVKSFYEQFTATSETLAIKKGMEYSNYCLATYGATIVVQDTFEA